MTTGASSGPIGVFDSGVGGLSVLRAVRQELPAEHLVYVADSKHAPYGSRSIEFILQRCEAIARFLVDQDAKAIVVACNTATAVAVKSLRAWCPVPMVAMEPAIKPAARTTRSGIVGVLATAHTVGSTAVARLRDQYGADADVRLVACPGLVERIERGDLASDATRGLVRQYVEPLVAAGADTLVLGCTHYAFVRPLIEDVAGRAVSIIDPAPAVASELRRRLGGDLRAATESAPTACFYSSSVDPRVSAVLADLWGNPVDLLPLPTGPAP